MKKYNLYVLNRRMAYVGITCLSFIAAAAQLLSLASCSDDTPTGTGTAAPAATNSDSTGTKQTLMVGEAGQLSVGGGDIIVGRTEAAERKLSDASRSQDYNAWARLVLPGEAYMVSEHTKCKLIGFGSGAMDFAVDHIQIKSGDNKGEDGWVPMEFVTK